MSSATIHVQHVKTKSPGATSCRLTVPALPALAPSASRTSIHAWIPMLDLREEFVKICELSRKSNHKTVRSGKGGTNTGSESWVTKEFWATRLIAIPLLLARQFSKEQSLHQPKKKKKQKVLASSCLVSLLVTTATAARYMRAMARKANRSFLTFRKSRGHLPSWHLKPTVLPSLGYA